MGSFGPLFGFPDWVAGLSPLEAAPKVTTDGVELNGLWWLIIVVAIAGAGAITLMRRRELATGG